MGFATVMVSRTISISHMVLVLRTMWLSQTVLVKRTTSVSWTVLLALNNMGFVDYSGVANYVGILGLFGFPHWSWCHDLFWFCEWFGLANGFTVSIREWYCRWSRWSRYVMVSRSPVWTAILWCCKVTCEPCDWFWSSLHLCLYVQPVLGNETNKKKSLVCDFLKKYFGLIF